jgi:hypothetical protein
VRERGRRGRRAQRRVRARHAARIADRRVGLARRVRPLCDAVLRPDGLRARHGKRRLAQDELPHLPRLLRRGRHLRVHTRLRPRVAVLGGAQP